MLNVPSMYLFDQSEHWFLQIWGLAWKALLLLALEGDAEMTFLA